MPLPPVYYPAGGYPQYPAGAPFPNTGAGYGLVNNIRNRIKRQTKSSKSNTKASNKSNKKSKNKLTESDSETKDHWGVHRILSTGIMKKLINSKLSPKIPQSIQTLIIPIYFRYACTTNVGSKRFNGLNI